MLLQQTTPVTAVGAPDVYQPLEGSDTGLQSAQRILIAFRRSQQAVGSVVVSFVGSAAVRGVRLQGVVERRRSVAVIFCVLVLFVQEL